MRRAIVTFVSLALLVPAISAQREPLAGFDTFVSKAVNDWRVPGLAIAVVKDGQVAFARGYGVRELGKTAPVDTHTLFAIGSTTKAMTAALVGMLVDEKKVDWGAPVTTYLPWFQLKDPAVTREVTVRDLLTHRAGLGNADYLWYGQHNSTEEILRRVRMIDPAYSLRSSFIYQNIMYAAAGGGVAVVTIQRRLAARPDRQPGARDRKRQRRSGIGGGIGLVERRRHVEVDAVHARRRPGRRRERQTAAVGGSVPRAVHAADDRTVRDVSDDEADQAA